MPKSELYAQSQDHFKFAIDFLNNYRSLINQPQNDSIANIIRKTKEYGFKYIKGDDSSLRKIKGDTDFSISLSNGRYLVNWLNNGRSIVECQFPANFGMMTFSNKIDLEKKMASKIENIKDSIISEHINLVSKNELDSVDYSDLYVKDNGFYITPRLRNLTVYKDSDSEKLCKLLTDFEGIYLLESVQNMMLTGHWPVPINVNLTLSEYGYKKSRFYKPLSGVYEIFNDEGSIPYWGIESFDGNLIKGLYVWKNEYGGFNHVLSVEIPLEILKTGGDIDANLFCYIRTDNLKYLFEEFM